MSYGNNLAEGSTGKGLESNSPSNSTVYCSCWGHSYPQTQQQQRTIAAGLYMCVKCCSYVQDSSSSEKCMENVWRITGILLKIWLLDFVSCDFRLTLSSSDRASAVQDAEQGTEHPGFAFRRSSPIPCSEPAQEAILPKETSLGNPWLQLPQNLVTCSSTSLAWAPAFWQHCAFRVPSF